MGVLQVLKALGLISVIDGDTFIKIATRIQSDWLRVTLPGAGSPASFPNTVPKRDEVWQTAVEAAKYFRGATALHNSDLYRNLALIAFMPAKRVRPASSALPALEQGTILSTSISGTSKETTSVLAQILVLSQIYVTPDHNEVKTLYAGLPWHKRR